MSTILWLTRQISQSVSSGSVKKRPDLFVSKFQKILRLFVNKFWYPPSWDLLIFWYSSLCMSYRAPFCWNSDGLLWTAIQSYINCLDFSAFEGRKLFTSLKGMWWCFRWWQCRCWESAEGFVVRSSSWNSRPTSAVSHVSCRLLAEGHQLPDSCPVQTTNEKAVHFLRFFWFMPSISDWLDNLWGFFWFMSWANSRWKACFFLKLLLIYGL